MHFVNSGLGRFFSLSLTPYVSFHRCIGFLASLMHLPHLRSHIWGGPSSDASRSLPGRPHRNRTPTETQSNAPAPLGGGPNTHPEAENLLQGIWRYDILIPDGKFGDEEDEMCWTLNNVRQMIKKMLIITKFMKRCHFAADQWFWMAVVLLFVNQKSWRV